MFKNSHLSNNLKRCRCLYRCSTKRQKNIYILCVVGSFFVGFIEARLLLSVEAYASILGSDNLDSKKILLSSIPLICIALMASISRILLIYCTNNNAAAVGTTLSLRSIEKVMYLPYASVRSLKPEELTSKFQHISKVVGCFLRPIANIFTSSIIVVFIITTSLYVEPTTVIISSLVIITYYIIASFFTNYTLKDISKRSGLYSTDFLDNLLVNLKSIKLLKVEKNESSVVRNLNVLDAKLRRLSAKSANISSVPRYILDFILIFLGVFILFFVSLDKSNESINLTSLIAKISLLVVLTQKIIPLIQSIYSSFAVIKSNTYAIDDLILIFDFCESQNHNLLDLSKINSITTDEKVLLRLYLVSRDNNPSSISISSGMTAIVGSSGVGKSTLIDTILMMNDSLVTSYSFNSSHPIFENMSSVNDFKEKWTSLLSYVPQTITLPGNSFCELISGSLLEENFDYKYAQELLTMLELNYLNIDKLDSSKRFKKVDLQSSMSGGEFQRLAIARALYHRKPILLLDEATSNLNFSLAYKIFCELKSVKHIYSIIAVVHDKRLLPAFDHVIEL